MVEKENTSTHILLITEGTYPFYGGGVSTWCHQLTRGLDEATFSIYAMTSNYKNEIKYDISASVKEVLQIPVWSVEGPHESLLQGQKIGKFLRKRENAENLGADEFDIVFATSFKQILRVMLSSNLETDTELNKLKRSFVELRHFFAEYDYKSVMTSKKVWDCFKETIHEVWPTELLDGVKLIDFVSAARLLYHFFIPLAMPIPKAEITHMTLAGVGIIPAIINKIKFGAPIILTEHGVFIRERLLAISETAYAPFVKRFLILLSEAIVRLSYREADKIMTVSEFNISWALRYGAQKRKIAVVYNGVDTSFFKPQKIPNSNRRPPTVIAAARVFGLKDIKTMIRACNEVSKIIDNVQFKVYGSKTAVPKYTRECEELIADLGLQENFELAGFHPTPHEIYHLGDISILTSISEGFPFTVIESMSCGIPVVATDVGGVSEALTEDCGFVCKPRDYKEIAEKVTLLLRDPELRNQMGANARKRVLGQFKIEKFISTFSEAYKAILTSEIKLPSISPMRNMDPVNAEN